MADAQVFETWRRWFDGDPEVLASAPGRVNLIGEHTDYNQGYVLPVAISLRTYVAAKIAGGPARFVSANAGGAVEFDVGKLPKRGWGRYVGACAMALRDEIGKPPPALFAAIASEVPKGSGLSSSAALTVSVLAAWNEAAGLKLDNLALADIAWKAETTYVGMDCGRMDQLAAAMGRSGQALFIDTRDVTVEYLPLPPEVVIAVLDTRKPRALADSVYNQRVAECRRAVEVVRRRHPHVESLRDVTTPLLEEALADGLDDVAYRRARHVITENQRTLDFRDALMRGDETALGVLCRASHMSLKEDYEVSCPELDAMARSAWQAPGCVAARMTGAGFGGCCVALVEEGRYGEFEASVKASYGIYPFREPAYYRVVASEGAKALAL